MIDRKTGNIRLTDSLELSPKLNFDVLENQSLGEVCEVRDMGNGYKWLDIKNIKIENEYYIISLCFNEERLIQLSMVVNDGRFDLSSDWSTWSEEEEKEALQKYQNWLNRELGRKTNFHWGDVWAAYDSKGGFSSIGIRYK